MVLHSAELRSPGNKEDPPDQDGADLAEWMMMNDNDDDDDDDDDEW